MIFTGLDRRRGVLCFGAVVLAGGMLLWLRRGNQEIEPAAPNAFVSELEFARYDDGQPIGELLQMPADGGIYAKIVLTPSADLPETLNDHAVQEPPRWPLGFFVYPRGSRVDGEETIGNPCVKFKRRGERFAFFPVRGTSLSNWRGAPGFQGDPKAPESWPDDELRFWTFFAAPDQIPGDYVYELTLYPTAAWTSSVRISMGAPVVLQRGVLRVVSDNG